MLKEFLVQLIVTGCYRNHCNQTVLALLNRFLKKKKMKTCCYNVPFKHLTANWEKRNWTIFYALFFTLFKFRSNICLFVSNFEKLFQVVLHMEMPQSFIMRMLIMSWPWPFLGSRFFVILYISSFEKIMVSKMLLVCLEHVLGQVLVFFN